MKSTLAAAMLGAATIAISSAPALADEDVTLVQCEESLGSIALVDGANAGWQQWDLGSPRLLIMQLANTSGCFTAHNSGDGSAARYLVTAIAGTKEEVDQGVNLATTAATEALVRSGAASSILSSVPFGGAALSMFGGLGGKKKTVSAALTVVSPATGQPLATGTGSVRRTSISFRGSSGAWGRGMAESTGYADSGEGRKLTEAFIIAFNELVAQRTALTAAPAAAAAAEPAAVAAVKTTMRAGPMATAAEVRSVREGTELVPTGNRDGLWIEVSDNFGTTGWVSVEDML